MGRPEPVESPVRSATVVVVTYNSGADIDDCVTSVVASAPRTRLEVIVVDNASSDDTLRIARELAAAHAEGTVVENQENVGFGAACNQGAALGTGDIVVLLNPDTVTHPGSIDALIDVSQRPGIGPVGGRTVDATGRLDPLSVQNAPRLRDTAVWAMGAQSWGRRLPGAAGRTLGRNPALLPVESFDHEHPAPVVIGCLLALRRPEWEALGGFDETFFMYGEDVDLSLRARQRGLVPTYTPDAVITHHVGRSSETMAAKLIVAMAGRVTVMTRHWSPRAAFVGRKLLVLGTALRATGERLAGRRGPWSETYARRDRWRGGYSAVGSSTDDWRNGNPS